MRLDDFLSTVGIIKRRTIAKELAANGMIEVNGQRVKPAYQIKLNDIIVTKGSKGGSYEVIDIPTGSVPKEKRSVYFRELKS